jgi:cellobiose phosphorylase
VAASGSLYEHCRRAIDRSLRVGPHGLPLIGSGDWNDGMNSIGDQGRGESVWMGWFLARNLNDFAEICDGRNDSQRAKKYRRHAKLLHRNIEANAWDGGWYLRAFFDDGTPLGSSRNDECRIDSLAQSWSLLAGIGNRRRSVKAMRAAEDQLIQKEAGLALLLTPPFDRGTLEPGYIKAYPPGIRENGGQYTHAAAWMIIAYALLGKGDRAAELFSMINPLNRTRTAEELDRYKIEPYVIAADVYAHPQHTGRGGWSWYTGAAGWMYRAALEYILGFQKYGDRLQISPSIPAGWDAFEIIYRYQETEYRITVENPEGVSGGVVKVSLDGTPVTDQTIRLTDDKQTHSVTVTLGRSEEKRRAAESLMQREKS